MSEEELFRRPTRLQVGDVMTRDVVTVSPDAAFKHIEQLMDEHHLSALPVLDAKGGVVGVVSEADLMLRTEAAAEEPGRWTHDARERRSKAHAQTAAGLMSSPAVTVPSNLPLAAAARLMRKQSVKRLPVVDSGRLVGIVSRADVLKSYLRSDAEIQSDVADGVIRGSMWLDPSTFDVKVDDGVVRLRGEVDRRSDVEILTTLTLAVEGVIGVDPTLTYRFDDRNVTPPKELGGI
ncbi:MAG TPA: CBS domain-containing protein [Candidatus Saccharimonadales bacterium]|nr:CBS domain-containing protein [Candidatus Saccharimonadales bacterium]